MAKEITGYVKLQIKGGQANPAPPVGPALGQRGINIMEFCKAFNEKTKSFIPGVVTESLIHPVMMDVPVAIVGGILEGTPSHPIFFNGSWSEIKESEVDTKIVKKYIDNYYNLEVDAHDIFGSSHNYIANGYVVSGLGDNDVLNDFFQRQKIFQDKEKVIYAL